MHDQFLRCLAHAVDRQTEEKRCFPRQYASLGRIDASELSLAIEGIGELTLPLTPAGAQALADCAKPARFGRREQTLLDPAVRDSGEIDSTRVQLSWTESKRAAMLGEIANALGLEAVDCQLHSLLVYGAGQFFKTHQDTEKGDRMVGTLVLIWPSAHLGGALAIRHGDSELRFESQQLGQTTELRWCAFYADCRHEVEPVTEGWRIALTFDLLMPADTHLPSIPPNPPLTAALRALFPPARSEPLVFLFDHEYSQHAFSWSMLKGTDRAYAQALRAAAGALGLNIRLALAEHHAIFDADFSRRSGAPRPGELIDSSLTLNWIEPAQLTEEDELYVPWDQIASFVDSRAEHLTDEQYEGYMGNYGETFEYWYRRAALLIQSELGELRTRFRIDFARALLDLLLSARSEPNSDQVTQAAATVCDLVRSAIARQGRELFVLVAALASQVDDEALALKLVESFEPERFEPADAIALAKLEHARGAIWMEELLAHWAKSQLGRLTSRSTVFADADAPALWPVELDHFVDIAIESGLSPGNIDVWLGHQVDLLVQYDRARAGHPAVTRLRVGPPLRTSIETLVRALARQRDHPAIERLARHCQGIPACHPAEELAPLAIALHAVSASVAAPLCAYVIDALERRIATPERGRQDHALHGIEWQCRCADCATMIRWAESPTGTLLQMPMNEARRQHVVHNLRLAAAPVETRTVKQGNPHRLELTKRTDLHGQERARRQRWQEALATMHALV